MVSQFVSLYRIDYRITTSLWREVTSDRLQSGYVKKVCAASNIPLAIALETFRNSLSLTANIFIKRRNRRIQPENPVQKPASALSSYLHPESCRPVHSPMPDLISRDLVTGIYYNVLFPQERQNKAFPALISYLFKSLAGEAVDFLSLEQLDTLNIYGLKAATRLVFSKRFSAYILENTEKQEAIDNALTIAESQIREKEIPKAKEIIQRLETLRLSVKNESPSYQRYTLLVAALRECIESLDGVISHEKKLLVEEFKKGREAGLALLLKSAQKNREPKAVDKEIHLERFENRLKVIEQTVNRVFNKTPNAACFLAVQEATPDAVEEMRERWKERNLTWISFNNQTGQITKVQPKEDVFGESTAFTSTVALSSALKVQRMLLGELPAPSGSARRILGVEVLNTQTGKPLVIFTTHTDHLVKDNLYHDTAMAVHQFVSKFLGDKLDMPFVFGGDLNAFETSGAAKFLAELREGPFAGGQDYREGEAFYSHEAIAVSTYLGRENDRFKANFAHGKLEANALDHILTKNVSVVAGVRDAAVFDEEGNLLDAHTQQEAYLRRLALRKTASDHFMNAVVFR